MKDILTNSFLLYGLNSKDEKTKFICRENFELNTTSIKEINNILNREFNAELKKRNEEDYMNIGNYLQSKEINARFKEHKLTEISQIIKNNKGEIKAKEDIIKEFKIARMKYNETSHYKVKKTVGITPQQTIHPVALYFCGLAPNREGIINTDKIEKEGFTDSIWIYTDGSYIKKNNEENAAYGIFFEENNNININMRARGKQTINNAEIQAVEHALLIIPYGQSACIWTDSEFVLNACNTFNKKKDKDKNMRKYKDIIIRIQKIIEIRRNYGAHTTVSRVFSHTLDLFNNKKTLSIEKRTKLENHYKEMIELYGEKTTRKIVLGNEGADKLAEIGRKNLLYPFLSITPEHEDYIIVPQKNKKGQEKKSKIDSQDNIKETLKQICYEKRLKKWKKYNNIFYKEKALMLENINIDYKASELLFRNKNYKWEIERNYMFKNVHEKFFTFPRAWEKVQEELEGKKRGTWYTDKYGNLESIDCLFCNEKVESIKHLTFECIYREKEQGELENEILDCIKEAIFLSTDDNEQIYQYAERKIMLDRKSEILKETIINKIKKEKDKQKKEKTKAIKGNNQTIVNKRDKEKKEKPKNIYEIEIPNEIYNNALNTNLKWYLEEEEEKDNELALLPNGLISKQFTKKLKEFNIKKKITKLLILTIQVLIAKYVRTVWIDRCKNHFNKKSPQ